MYSRKVFQIMKKLDRFSKGMGIGGWLTNYKRFNVLPDEWRQVITVGDMEHFATYITENDVKYIKELGMDHIRLGFDQIVLEESPYIYRKEIFDILHNFVDWCKKYDLRVVLNMHKAIGNYCDIKEEVSLMDSDELQNRFIALWLEIEKEFSGDNDIMFEILNEVRDVDPTLWNNLAEKTVDAIRRFNKERLIVVGGIEWGNPNRLKDLKIFDDNNVIYSFHCYTPYEFTHQQSVLMAPPLYYNRKLAYPCEDMDRYRGYHWLLSGADTYPYPDYEKIDIQILYDELKGVKEFIDKNPDKILWCGEFGTIRHADMKSRENWMRDMIKICLEYDIPYSVWNYLSTPNDGNRFSLVDDDSRKILSEEMAKIIRGDV